MDKIKNWTHGETVHIVIGILIFLAALAVVILIYRWVTRKVTEKVQKTPGMVDDFVVEVLKLPFLFLLIWIVLKIFSRTMFFDTRYYPVMDHTLEVFLIAAVGWILIKVTQIVFYYMDRKLSEDDLHNFKVRGSLTKLSIFKKMIIGLITVLTLAAALMTFDSIRTVGIGLLSSAGVAGIIIGFAAQKSLGSIMAGIQIAITQPIKLDDKVVIQGNVGNIEEINLTYVVVKTWDERRLILPINYFLDNPIENWTRNTSNITGMVYLYADYKMPLEPLRAKLKEILTNNPKWDGRMASMDVTDMTDTHLQLRIVFSCRNSGDSWGLQVEIREKMVEFMQQNYPQFFPRTRIREVQKEHTDVSEPEPDLHGKTDLSQNGTDLQKDMDAKSDSEPAGRSDS